MAGIRIVATGKALPKKVVTNDDLSKTIDTSDEWIQTRTGIKQRYFCTEDESCLTLAIDAAKQTLLNANVDVEKIGAVIVATSTPDTIFPSMACLVAQALGLSEEVMTFDLSAACTGFLYGMGVANGLLATMTKEYVLVIGSEQLSRIMNFEDRSSCILFGDGAAATLLGKSEKPFFQKSWSRANHDALNCLGPGKDENILAMNGKDVFRFAVGALEHAIKEILKFANKTMDDVDVVVCHQANARIIGHVMKKFSGHEDKFYMNIENYGNTSAASIPLVLDDLQKQGGLNTKTRLVLVGFGAGLTWSSAYFEV